MLWAPQAKAVQLGTSRDHQKARLPLLRQAAGEYVITYEYLYISYKL
jgi:hypothetical protein